MENKETKKKAPVGVVAAFAAGAAVGATAGLLAEKKNREKAAKIARQAGAKAQVVARAGLEKAKERAATIRERLQKEKEETVEPVEEAKEQPPAA